MGILRSRGVSADDTARIPPGQHRVKDFPVLHVGNVPYETAPPDWDFKVWGEVESPMRWSLAELRALPATEVTTDIHCVTSWSKLDTRWKGVSLPWILERIRPTPAAAHVLAHADGGYTANVPLKVLHDDDVLLAYEFDGRELAPEHGRPLRLLVPKKYFWKSAKWLRGLEFLSEDRLGYWERYGYSNSADPWKEERYAF